MIPNWLIHACCSDAALICQGYLDEVAVGMYLDLVFLHVEVSGIDRAGLNWTEKGLASPLKPQGQAAIDCARLLSRNLIEKIRRFEEDRELNLTP